MLDCTFPGHVVQCISLLWALKLIALVMNRISMPVGLIQVLAEMHHLLISLLDLRPISIDALITPPTFPIFPIIPVFLLASYNFIFFKKIPIFY